MRAANVGVRILASAALLAGPVTSRALDSAPTANDVSAPTPAAVVGMLGSTPVHASDLAASNPDAFAALQKARDQSVRQAELQFEQSRHDLLAKELDKLLDRRALELEAAAQHVKPESVLMQIRVPIVTDDEARAFYESRKDLLQSQPYDALASPIKQYLANQHDEDATRSFYDQLRAKYAIKSLLGPYRVSVAAVGPVRGDKNAPITILEFGDFQCPYCRHAEPVLQSLVREHAGQVRIVFRYLPLIHLHPDAQVAAEAGVCAERQGKFWEMHDAMFEHQDELKPDALRATAARLGLDGNRFAACLGDKAVQRTIQTDVDAAADAGVANTPYFFIDGRPVLGDVPKDEFERIINEELAALRKSRS